MGISNEGRALVACCSERDAELVQAALRTMHNVGSWLLPKDQRDASLVMRLTGEPTIHEFLIVMNPDVDDAYAEKKCKAWAQSPAALVATFDPERKRAFVAWCQMLYNAGKGRV